MIQVSSAFLCDAATVREGLLHAIGGGVTRLWRPILPAPLGVSLAAIITVDEADLGRPHQVDIKVTNPDGGSVLSAVGILMAPRPERLEPGELLHLPLVQAFDGAQVTVHGRHRVRLDIDAGGAIWELDFWALHPEETILPPL